MALKTFNIDEKVYAEFSKHSKRNGISMSRQVENFLKQEIEKITKTSQKVKLPTEKEIRKVEKILEHPLQKYC